MKSGSGATSVSAVCSGKIAQRDQSLQPGDPTSGDQHLGGPMVARCVHAFSLCPTQAACAMS